MEKDEDDEVKNEAKEEEESSDEDKQKDETPEDADVRVVNHELERLANVSQL